MPRILIIDDEREIVEIVQMSLEFAGHDVSAAYDGGSGLNQALATLPDLVLLDVSMPVMNGYEVCQKLKKDNRTKKIPVILLTAKAQASDVKSGTDAGCDAYVTKPFEMRDLLDKVNRFLKK